MTNRSSANDLATLNVTTGIGLVTLILFFALEQIIELNSLKNKNFQDVGKSDTLF